MRQRRRRWPGIIAGRARWRCPDLLVTAYRIARRRRLQCELAERGARQHPQPERTTRRVTSVQTSIHGRARFEDDTLGNVRPMKLCRTRAVRCNRAHLLFVVLLLAIYLATLVFFHLELADTSSRRRETPDLQVPASEWIPDSVDHPRWRLLPKHTIATRLVRSVFTRATLC